MKKITTTLFKTQFVWETEIIPSKLIISCLSTGLNTWLKNEVNKAKPTNPLDCDENGKPTLAFKIKTARKTLGQIKSNSFNPNKKSKNRQSPEDKAWISYFNAIQHNENNKPVQTQTLIQAQKWACRQFLLSKYEIGTPERKEIETNLSKHLDENFQSFIESEQKTNEAIKSGIHYHKMISALK